MKTHFVLLISLLVFSGCDFDTSFFDKKFGKQNFVSAVSIIELHKVRNGEYPESLQDLEFLGDWDQIWLGAVEYEKTDSGYNLTIRRGWIAEPDLSFPVRFKQGLGIEETNVEWVRPPEKVEEHELI